MPCEIEWRGNTVHWKFYGDVTADQIIDAYGSLYGASRFDDTRAQIRDYSLVESLSLSVEEVLKVAAFDKAAALSNPQMKVALVTKDLDHSTLAALYDLELEESAWNVGLFDCANEAAKWAA